MKINILGNWSSKRLIPTILCLFLMTTIRCHYGDLSDVDSTFQSMFKSFSNIFDSAPERELSPSPSTAVKEVKFTDENGNLKAEDQIKKEIETKFNVHNADSLGIDSVIHDLVSKGIPAESKGRKLNGDLETKIQRAMNLGLGGELLSEDPEIKEMDSVKKNKNFVEFDNSANINDHMEKDFKTRKGKGSIKEKTWGSHVVKHRIGENGLKTVETMHRTNKVMKKVSKGQNGNSSFQEMSFSSSSSNENPSMQMPEMKDSMPDMEDPLMSDMFFPEDEIKKMNDMQAKMMGNLDQMFASPEDFVKVAPPRRLRQKRRKRRNRRKKSKKHKKRRKSRKLNNYDYEYPESVYGFNSHIIENPVNCPDCGENSYIPKIDYDNFNSQELNQFQENNYIDQQTNMNQQNMQQNNINNIHNHHYHSAFDPSLASNIGVEDYDKMEKLYQDYLNALIEFNHEVPSNASARAVGKQMTVLEHQLANHHQKNPYFGSEPITLPPMMSTDSELAMHFPTKITTPVIPKTTVHHHYITPSYNEYTFNALPMVPAVQTPTPEMIHNYELLMDAPHPLASMVQPQAAIKQTEESHKELQHMKKDLEIEFKNDLQIEVGNVIKHEDQLQKETDEEIHHLMDLTRSVQDSVKQPAPTLNVEHTVMGVDGHSIHETKEGEIIVENHSESHSIKDNGGDGYGGDGYGGNGYKGDTYGGDSGSSSAPSEHTEVIQKVTPIIIGNPGGFGGSDDSYSGSSSTSSNTSRSYTSRNKSGISKDNGSEEVIIKEGGQITTQHVENDHDEDHNKILDSSVDNSSEVHSKNSIYNEKNTHIVHHMGAPSDSKVLNIHLDLLSDGKGGFYFQDKDGKPIGSAGTLTEKYDVLNHQLDTLRVKEAANFKKTGKLNDQGMIDEASNLSNMGDENITTQINKIDDLHEVTNEDLKNIGKGDQHTLEAIVPSDKIMDADDISHDETEGLNDDLETKMVTPLDEEQDSSIHQDLDSVSNQSSDINVDNLIDEASVHSQSIKSVQSSIEAENIVPDDQTSTSQVSEHLSNVVNEDEITPDVQSVVSGQSGMINEDEITPDVQSAVSSQSGIINEDEITPDTQSVVSGQSGIINEDEITPDSQSAVSKLSDTVNEDEITPDTQSTVSSQSGNINQDELNPSVIEEDKSSSTDVDADIELSNKSDMLNKDELSPDITSESQLSVKSDLVNEDEITPDINSALSQTSAQSGLVDEDDLSALPQTSEQSDMVDQEGISSENKSNTSGLVDEDDLETVSADQSQISGLVDDQNMNVDNQSGLVDEDDIEKLSADNQSALVDSENLATVNTDNQSGLVDEDDISSGNLSADNQSGLVDEDDISSANNLDNQSGLVDEDDLQTVKTDDQSGLVDSENLTTVNTDNQSELVDEDDISAVNNLDNQSGLVDEDDLETVDIDNKSGVADLDDSSPKDRLLKFRHREDNNLNNANPFKHHSPIFEEMRGNFLVNPPSPEPRSMKEIAAEFDKKFGDSQDKEESLKFIEPRELFENLDVTAKLRSKLGIGKKGNYVQDYKPLF